MIKVQEAPFDAAAELRQFRSANGTSGATAMFIGTAVSYTHLTLPTNREV